MFLRFAQVKSCFITLPAFVITSVRVLFRHSACLCTVNILLLNLYTFISNFKLVSMLF